MTYQIGDPGHLAVHNTLVGEVQAQADRMAVDVVLPPQRVVGESGHTDDHNLIVTALEQIAAAPGGMTWAQATGGTTSDVTIDGAPHRAHAFTSNGTLAVTRAGWARCLIVGGGGGGAVSSGGGGGGVITGVFWLPVGDHAVTIGGGGAVSASGGATSFAPVGSCGGGQGPVGPQPGHGGGGGAAGYGAGMGGGGAGGPASGGNGGPGRVSNIATGAVLEYGMGGAGSGGTGDEAGWSGHGGDAGGAAGYRGAAGQVVIAVEVAA